MPTLIEDNLEAYVRAYVEYEKFSIINAKRPPKEQDWEERNDLAGVAQRRKDGLLFLINQAVNRGTLE